MRYSRLVNKLEMGGVTKSRAIRTASRVTKSKPVSRAASKAAKKGKSRPDDESESAVSSDGDGEESEREVKDETEERLPSRRTRGIQIDLKDVFGSGSSENVEDDSDSSIDDYKFPDDEEIDDEDDFGDIERASKNNDKGGRYRRSSTPPITPGRFASSAKRTLPRITPPSSNQEKRSKRASASPSATPTIRSLDYDDRVRKDLSGFKVGMMVPRSSRSIPPASSKARSGPSNVYNAISVEESDMIQSIEHDAEEEFDEAQGDREDEDEDMDDDAANGPQVTLLSKKSKFFFWL